MKILQTNYNYQPQTNFKATYPVVHRVIRNGVYIPVSDFNELKKMQSKLIRTLNSSFAKILNSLDKEAQQNVLKWTQSDNLSNATGLSLPKTEKEALAIFRGRFGYYDIDYAYAPKSKKTEKNKRVDSEERVRSFYNRKKGLLDGRYYLAYMISGKDLIPFKKYVKDIGNTKHEAKGINLEEAPELQEAIDSAVEKYVTKGLEFVNEKERRLASKDTGMTYVLQSNFEPVLNKSGEFKDYKFISVKFVPEYTK